MRGLTQIVEVLRDLTNVSLQDRPRKRESFPPQSAVPLAHLLVQVVQRQEVAIVVRSIFWSLLPFKVLLRRDL